MLRPRCGFRFCSIGLNCRLENLGVRSQAEDSLVIFVCLCRNGLAAMRAFSGIDADARRHGLPAARASAHLDLGLISCKRTWSEAHGRTFLPLVGRIRSRWLAARPWPGFHGVSRGFASVSRHFSWLAIPSGNHNPVYLLIRQTIRFVSILFKLFILFSEKGVIFVHVSEAEMNTNLFPVH